MTILLTNLSVPADAVPGTIVGTLSMLDGMDAITANFILDRGASGYFDVDLNGNITTVWSTPLPIQGYYPIRVCGVATNTAMTDKDWFVISVIPPISVQGNPGPTTPPAGAIPVSEATTLTAAGVYYLTTNLSGLAVAGDNISVYGAGFSPGELLVGNTFNFEGILLDGLNINVPTTIYGNVSGSVTTPAVILQNSTVSAFSGGAAVITVGNNITIRNCTFNDTTLPDDQTNHYSAYNFNPSFPGALEYVVGIVVENCTFTATGDCTVEFIGGVVDCTVSNNLSGSRIGGWYGPGFPSVSSLSLSPLTGNTFTGNTFQNAGSQASWVFAVDGQLGEANSDAQATAAYPGNTFTNNVYTGA
jgi:hypothetical protein